VSGTVASEWHGAHILEKYENLKLFKFHKQQLLKKFNLEIQIRKCQNPKIFKFKKMLKCKKNKFGNIQIQKLLDSKIVQIRNYSNLKNRSRNGNKKRERKKQKR
jgi:hypothetical protein